MVTIVDKSAVVLGNSTITGDFGLTTNGAITDSAAGTAVLVQSGTTTLEAGTGNNITLDASGHDFQKVSVVSGYDVTLNDTGAAGLILLTSDISGTFTVDAVGTVSQEGALTAGGAVDVASSTGDVTLDETENSYNKIAASGVNVTLFNGGDIDLNGVTATGNLVVDVVGQIIDSAATNVSGTGTSSFTARTAGGGYDDIQLDVLGADYGVSLSLEGNGITLANNNAAAMLDLVIASATATGDLTITLSGAAQTVNNGSGSNMSIDGNTSIESTGTGATAITLDTTGCKFHDYVFGDPTDDLTNFPSLYLDAATVTVNP